MLDFSKIEARKLELDPQAIDLPAFLQGVTEICQIHADQKEINFTHYSSPDHLPDNFTIKHL